MTRQKKEQIKKNLKLFYITTIENVSTFDYWLDNWLFYQASLTYKISYRTAKRYFFEVVPEDFRKEHEYQYLTIYLLCVIMQLQIKKGSKPNEKDSR